METIVIYTDGGCKPNPGAGGWGAVIVRGGSEQSLSGGESATTNNRMEMTAALRALESLPAGQSVVLYTDSSYLKNGITSWMPAWRRRGWKTTGGTDVLNRDLWESLDVAMSQHRVQWKWVRGHAGNAGNTKADRLATEARERYGSARRPSAESRAFGR